MARIYGLNGVIRGRQGNNVFSVQNGIQVVKAYQPAVSNPKTVSQREQRAKFALAGKFSGITPSGALVGMDGGNARSRRARFVASLIQSAVVSGEINNLVANVAFENVVFSEGNLACYSSVPTVTAAWSGTDPRALVTVNVPAMNLVASGVPSGYGEIAVVCLFDASTSSLDEVQFAVRSRTAGSSFAFRLGARRDVRAVVYSVPFAPQNSLSSPSASNLYETESAANISFSSETFLSGMRFGHSVLLSNIGVIGGSQSNALPPDVNRDAVVDPDNGDVMKATNKN